MQTFLTQSKTLWTAFAAFVLMTLGFAAIMAIWDFVLIDEMSDPAVIRAHLAEMTATQKSVHMWTTATLDVLYPLAYGSLFAGMALRFFGQWGWWIALPSFLVIPVDLTEGAVQVMALAGNLDVLWMKAYVTPLKLVLFLFGVAATLVATVIAIRQRMA